MDQVHHLHRNNSIADSPTSPINSHRLCSFLHCLFKKINSEIKRFFKSLKIAVHVFFRAAREENAYSRMKEVVRWYLSGFYKKPKVSEQKGIIKFILH